MTAVEHGIVDTEHPHYVTSMQQPETAKNVHVYLNGDKFYPGRKFVINRRHVADFDGFLNQVSVVRSIVVGKRLFLNVCLTNRCA